jgi:hypothetical protein
MTLGEFVKQFAALMQQKSISMPLKNERPWHALFYRLKTSREPGRPLFLDRLRFDWDGPHPKCRELSEFLKALHWNASATATNPHYDTITLTEDVARLWSTRLDGAAPDTRGFMERAAEQARQEFART